MAHNATSDSDVPPAVVETPINVQNGADSAATEDLSRSSNANGYTVNDERLRADELLRANEILMLTNGFQRVIPPWLEDFEFFYNTVDFHLPENIRLLVYENGRPLRARLTMRGERNVYEVSHLKMVLRLCNYEKVTGISWEAAVLTSGEPERAKLELGNRVYVGSTVLLLRILEEATLITEVRQ